MFYKEADFKDEPLIGEIPKDWESIKLEEVVEIHDSKRIPLSEIERKNRKGQYPYCGANGIIDYIDDYIFDGEFVLLAEDGGSYGRLENTAYIMNGKFWVNNHAHILRAIEGKTSNLFLKHALDFLDLNPYIVGSTRKKLNQEQMREIKIPFPPFEEQRAIVGVLGVVDSVIAKTGEVIAKTERLKKGLMQTLLTRGIGHKEYKQTPIGTIPKEWEVVKVKDVANLQSGGTPSRDKPEYWENGTIPWIKSGELNDAEIYNAEEKITELGLKNSNAKIFPKGTLLMALYGKGTVSKTAILRIDAATNQAVCAFTPKNGNFNPKYMQHCLIFMRNRLLNQLTNPSSDVGRTNIYMGMLESFKIPLPKKVEEQKKIAEILSTADEELNLLRSEKLKFERIKRGLMDLLLTGKIRVKV